jgi:hypothetical protein
MFKQQSKAAGYLPYQAFNTLAVALRRAGYEGHTGPKVQRDREVAAFRKTFESARGLRQNHVQIAENNNTLAIYAHTEPHTDELVDHAISAIFDGASFQGGSKMLKNDLAAEGVELMSHAAAARAAKAEFVQRVGRGR